MGKILIKIDGSLGTFGEGIMSSRIAIRFIRKNETSDTDAQVFIKDVGKDLYSLSFMDGYSNSPHMHSALLNDRNLFRWLRITLRLLENDSDPFDSIQMDMPIMPSLMVDIHKIGSAYHTILDMVEFHLDNWTHVSA
jgi:hypothetical protein